MNVKGFIGKSTTTVDAKGRCSFPKELRKYLAPENEGKVVVTVGMEKSLTLYPVTEWNSYVEELNSRPRTRDNIRLQRLVTHNAKESVLDGQNRISLNEYLKQFASIAGEVTFAGDGKTVSLWNPEAYRDKYESFSDEDLSQLDDMFYWDEEAGQS